MATNYYNRLTTLFTLIDRGDPSIGLPPYNGGLFAPEAAPLLQRVQLADDVVAPIIYELSHTRTAPKEDATRPFVNYRDMSVQQLGSIYERLLEQEPARSEDGKVTMRPNPYARKDSGSYYTPQELVDLIVEKTSPAPDGRTSRGLRGESSATQERSAAAWPNAGRSWPRLTRAWPVLDVKILDPAMGSGHFLVTAVDYVADQIADPHRIRARSAGLARQ